MNLEINKEYPVRMHINPDIHGPFGSRKSRFTIITDGRTVLSNCKYEGIPGIFSTSYGQIIMDAVFFRLQ